MTTIEGTMLIVTGAVSVAIYFNLLVIIEVLKRIEAALPPQKEESK